MIAIMKNRLALFLLAIGSLALLAPAAAPKKSPFDGTWDTDWLRHWENSHANAPVYIVSEPYGAGEVDGLVEVTGWDGLMSGTVVGRVYSGSWHNLDGVNGKFELTLGDTHHFHGWYNISTQPPDKHYDWNGTR